MTKSIIHRGGVTDLLLLTLRALAGDWPVGDSEAPEHNPNGATQAGWNGEPNAPGSVFVPYMVLTPQTATQSSGSVRDPQDGWRLPYALAYFGVSRSQVEALANEARKALAALPRSLHVLDGASYKVQQVEFSALGGVGRVDATSPSTFGEVDSITVWITQ